MSTWSGSEITEASGLAYSLRWPYHAYVHNDENGPVYCVDLRTGRVVGRCSVKDHTLVDPESIDIDSKGTLWFADIGDNSEVRSSVNVYTRGEFGPTQQGSKPWTRYNLKYPGGASHNAETFICWPNGKKQIVSKVASGVVYQLPTSLKTGASNTMTAVVGPSASLNLVSDAVASRDGRFAFVLRKDQNSTIYVFNSSWTQIDTISMPAMTKPEGIGIQKDGKVLIVCDDTGGTGGVYQKVKIPGTYCPAGSLKYDDDTTVTPPADPAPAPPVNPCSV